jgi:hypothetical protein
MYRKMLAVHLCMGMFCFAFLAMYGVSAVQMAHRKWFRLSDQVTEQRFTLIPGVFDARAVARLLPFRGELSSVRPAPDELRFAIARPGVVSEVRYSTVSGAAFVRIHESGVGGALNRIHQIRGLGHGYPPLNAWAAVLGLVSLGLVILGVTGLWLWFQNQKERRIGAVLLAAGASLAIVLIVWMRAG